MNFLSQSEKETGAFGKKLAAKLKGGEVILLYGELGAGKTALVKGLAAGLGIKKTITSPTFALMNVSSIKTLKHKNIKTKGQKEKFVHIDTYRLKDAQELIDIGVEDYLGAPDTICAIEWPEKIEGLLKKIRQRRTGLGPDKIVAVTIKHLANGGRKIIF